MADGLQLGRQCCVVILRGFERMQLVRQTGLLKNDGRLPDSTYFVKETGNVFYGVLR